MFITNSQNLNRIPWPAPFELRLGKKWSLEVPPLRDPRYLVWVFQLIFFVIGVQVGAFSKSYDALALSVFVGGILDLILNSVKLGRLVLPQSGFIAGTGVALLLECTDLRYYALGTFCAVLSKHVFQFGGRHTFNPSAYGALLVILLFPQYVVSNVTQWGGLTWFTVFIWCAGLIAVSRAKVLSVAMLWIGWFAVFAVARAFYIHAPIPVVLGTISGPSFALFSFFMITDPRTTPATFGKRVLFCGLAAAVDAEFRLYANPYAIFWGLVLASAMYPFAERLLMLFSKEVSNSPTLAHKGS